MKDIKDESKFLRIKVKLTGEKYPQYKIIRVKLVSEDYRPKACRLIVTDYMIDDALEEIKIWQAKYSNYKLFAPVIDAIKKIERKHLNAKKTSRGK